MQDSYLVLSFIPILNLNFFLQKTKNLNLQLPKTEITNKFLNTNYEKLHRLATEILARGFASTNLHSNSSDHDSRFG